MRNDVLDEGVPERYFLASADNWGYYEYPDGFLNVGIAPLYPEKETRKTITFTFHQDDTDNTLTNAQSARDSLYKWYNLTGEELPEYRLALGKNCLLPWPKAPRPVEPVVPLYPNPAQDFITIRLPQKDTKHLKIYNISGQLLLEQEIIHSPFLIDFPDMVLETEIDISRLPKGFYAAQIEGENNEIQIHKFLKM